jgi:putative ABC transport system substrate-binding protein
MKRREFITLIGGAAMWPLAARAQRANGRIARIAFLSISSPQALDPRSIEQFRLGLAENGLIDGRDITVEYFWAQGSQDLLRDLAAELGQRNFDLIVTAGVQPVRALQAAEIKSPIVFAIHSDPVGDKAVESLARPGGNVTGLSMLNANLEGKRLEVLKEVLPALNRVLILHDLTMGGSALADAQAAARVLALETQIAEISNSDQFNGAFAEGTNQGANGLATLASAFFNFHRKQLINLTSRHRFPSVWEAAVFVRDGGLLSYGPNFPDMYRRSAGYIAKILGGAKPSDLPVEQPVKFELAVNLKTAKALGLEVPPSLLARADEVIE